jgi:uncharacterized protein YhaN
MVARTGELFSGLTLGAFDGVRAEFDAKGRPVIMGVRRGSSRLVSVDAMSDGTADQLYLAFRLASIERYIEHNEPLPFVLDDILIRFDDTRSAAALKILGTLSRKTQVVFFTHHHHLVEVARQHVDPDMLFTHALSESEE